MTFDIDTKGVEDVKFLDSLRLKGQTVIGTRCHSCLFLIHFNRLERNPFFSLLLSKARPLLYAISHTLIHTLCLSKAIVGDLVGPICIHSLTVDYYMSIATIGTSDMECLFYENAVSMCLLLVHVTW